METLPAIAALVAGLVFGATVQRTNFCTTGALSDVLLFGDWRRLRAWLLAIAIALIGSRALDLAGVVDLERSLYHAAGPVLAAAIAGGLIFGFGMTLTGGCVSKNLVRLGAGSLKSLAVLALFAVAAAATAAGLALLAPQPLPEPARGTGIPQVLVSVLLGGGLLVFCLRDRRFRRSPRDLAAGLVLGGLVPLVWLAGRAQDGGAALNFVTPVVLPLRNLLAADSMIAGSGAVLVVGVVAGAFAAARASSSFRVERFAGRDDLRRNLIGAGCMGVGGALAMGCTIGQGVSGVSALAPASLVALLAIVAGGVAGVRYLEHGSLRGAARALFAGS